MENPRSYNATKNLPQMEQEWLFYLKVRSIIQAVPRLRRNYKA